MELTFINRNGVAPFYFQIQQQLYERIRLGELKPGDALPSEHELSTRLGVSRMTARLAIKSLCELGIVYTKQGKGSFVSGLKLEKNFRQVLSFTEEMALQGRQARSRILGFEIIPAEAEVAQALRIKRRERVVRLQRLRIADSIPMGIESSYLPDSLCPGLKDAFDPRTSLYQTLSDRYGIQMAIADEVIESGMAKAEEARLLRIKKGSPIFSFARTSYVQQGQPVEYVKSTYRADRYRIVNRLVRLKHEFIERDIKNG
jgi:GntR family transcriptional regulator